jgi:DNA-binding NtrC family response regulator
MLRSLARVAALALDPCLARLGRRGIAQSDTAERFEGLIGRSPAMRAVYRLIEQVAPSDSSVLLLGESGTGKELAARAIHLRSARHGQPFVPINCPSIPRELIESELFGHEKGSFTGADARRPGKVELADGGTLFLDEVGDMAVATQVRLLRFLEEREFQRVGGRETLHVDVRILAATSRDLAAEVERGTFRQDLYYRLNVVPIRLPSLRERRDDLPALCEHFLAALAKRGVPRRILSERVLQSLVAHDWPGNVRELRNTLEYMATVAGDEVLTEANLPAGLRGRAGAPPASSPVDTAGNPTLHAGETLASRLSEVEAVLIRRALEDADWNQCEAARRLGITETKVRNRRRQYGIRRPGEKGGSE